MSGSAEPAADVPGVIVFPPLILLAVVVLGVVLDLAVPLDFDAGLPRACACSQDL